LGLANGKAKTPVAGGFGRRVGIAHFRPAASREGCGSYLTASYGTTAPAQLEAWGERMLDAATLAAVLAEG
jgi:hypothetical protein